MSEKISLDSSVIIHFNSQEYILAIIVRYNLNDIYKIIHDYHLLLKNFILITN